MKITRVVVISTLFLSLVQNAVLGHVFGSIPLQDVLSAAENYNQCSSLPTDKLVAYMLSPTWWEVTGANSDLTPAPMALSRWDYNRNLFPPGQGSATSPDRRAFWHPGIGAWQLDDAGLGSGLSWGKFNTYDAAILIAETMSARYCNQPSAYSVFGPWCACGSDGTCSAPDRDRCEATFKKIYNSNGPPEHPIEEDPSTGRFGGSQVRSCNILGGSAAFVCIYVNPGNAEGYTGDINGTPYGWVSYPESAVPLSKPFYVYKELDGSTFYEWRYWMAADTGFAIDYAARRRYGTNSRDDLWWFSNVDESTFALCDLTASRGICAPVCSASSTLVMGSLDLVCAPAPELPTITTNPATNLTAESATLNLSVNPKGAPTDIWFEWGFTSSLGMLTERQAVEAGTSSIPISLTLGGLTCNTTYFFRAAAENTVGSTRGNTSSFTTALCGTGPTTETRELLFNGDFEQGPAFWSSVGGFYIGAASRPRAGSYYAFLSTPTWSAGNNLYGEILNVVTDVPANSESVTFSFWFSITTDETSSTTKFDNLYVDLIDFGVGTQRLLILSNLDSTGGPYLHRIFDISQYAGHSIGVKFTGQTDGSLPTVFRIDDVSVTAVVPEAGIPPWVVTQAADQLTASSARLNLSVNPNELDTDVWFEWGLGSSLTSSTRHLAVGRGSTILDVSESLFGLNCETTYSFRALAQNTQGQDQGLLRSFTTSACPGGSPSADTDPADSITRDSARLTGAVNPNQLPTEAWFEWGTSMSLGATTPRQSVPAGTQYIDVTQGLSGLSCDTNYYFQLWAENSEGISGGTILSFTTNACSGLPSAITLTSDTITKTSARLVAQVNPNGSATQSWFVWGVTTAFGATSVHQDVGQGTAFNTVYHLVSDLQCGKSYHFKVIAENSYGSTEGDTQVFSTLDCDPGEAPPGNFLAWTERQTCNGNQPAVLFRWSPSSGASSIYTIRRSDGAYVRAVDTRLEGFAHLVTDGLHYNQGYDFYVIAQNEVGTTPSNGVRVHVIDQECLGAGDPADPPGPFILWREPFVCHNGHLAVELHWSRAAGVETYTLERLVENPGIGRTVESFAGTSYVDETDLIPGLLHVYTVTAYNESGSTRVQFSLDVYPPSGLCGETGLPGQFQLTAGEPFCLDGEPAIPINWTESNGADEIYRYKVHGKASVIGGGTSSQFSKDITAGVHPDQVHEIYMIATDPEDSTRVRFSNTVFVNVPIDVCGTPALLPETTTRTPSGVTDSTAVFRSQVRPNGSPTYAWFEWGETAAYGNLTSEVDIGTTTLYTERPSMQITALNCGTEYHYRVVALNSSGQSFGNDVSFVTDSCPACGPPSLMLSNMIVSSPEQYEACNSISVGPNVSIERTGFLELAAPLVIFGDGFSVQSGGKLLVESPSN